MLIFENNELIDIRQNQLTKIRNEHGMTIRVLPFIDGTVIKYAKVRKVAKEFVVTLFRYADGLKLTQPVRFKFDTIEDVKQAFANVFSYKENNNE